MLSSMRAALQVSNNLAILNPGYSALNYKDVFHLATLGGAAGESISESHVYILLLIFHFLYILTALAVDDEVGNFSPGKQFDALVIDLNVSIGPLDDLVEYTLEERLQRFVHSGDDRNIVEVYVAGHRVK